VKIIFGHWAALEGQINKKNLYPLDTGYLWGGKMRLMNIDTKEFFHCSHK
jgi:bis(5'-nucleosyl)-tetraphosphatase (symmetrical)